MVTLFQASLALLSAALLGACVNSSQPPVVPPVPDPAPVSLPFPLPVEPTTASVAASGYFAEVQSRLLSQGLLRSDAGGLDTPFTDSMLTENFIRVALYDEYALGLAGPVQRETASRLRRWVEPVRVSLRFGASVPPERRATDTARVVSYLARLQALTGHPISLSDSNANFVIAFLSEDERRAFGPEIAATVPGLTSADIRGITELPRSTYCLVYAITKGGQSTYSRAFAVIRAEHPDLLRLSCIHEEIAQALGLPNDSPLARPSIFNDDEEFALLTRQDEMMLRILYNPALRPGMTEAEARPIIKDLAESLIGNAS